MTERVKGGSERVWGGRMNRFGSVDVLVVGGLESDDSLSVYLHGSMIL
jgi:hypothetical protein